MAYPTTITATLEEEAEAIRLAAEEEREEERRRGIYPTITNTGLEEVDARKAMLEAERIQKIQTKYDPLYTDPVAFEKYAKDPAIQEAKRWALDPKDVSEGILNREYLSDLAGRRLRGPEYEAARDAFAKNQWGLEEITDLEFYEHTKADRESVKQANAAQLDLDRRLIQETFRATTENRPTDRSTVFNDWRNTYQDIVAPDKEGRYFTASRKSADEFAALVADNAPAGASIWKLLEDMRAGTATSTDVRALAEQVSTIPFRDQQRLADFAAVAASDLTEDQRKTIGKLFENTVRSVGESFGPITGMGQQWEATHERSLIGQLGGPTLQDQENAVAQRISELESGAALPKKGVARPAYGAVELEAPPPPEQAAAMIEALKREQAVLRTIRLFKNTFNNKVNPIRPIFEDTGMFSAGSLEKGFYGLAGSTGYMTAAAIPYVGVPLTFAMMQGQEYEQYMSQNPGMDPRVATALSTVSAAPEAMIEKLQVETMMGHLPATGRMFAGMQNKVGRYLANTTVALGAENVQEAAQDALNTFIPLLAANLREDMPDRDPTVVIQDYFDQRAAVFWSLLIPGMIGGGFATIEDLKDPASVLDPRLLRYAGYSPEQVDTILRSPDPSATMRELMPQRTPENIEAGIAELETDMTSAAAAQNDPLRPTMEAVTLADGTKEYRILRSVPEEIEAEFLPDKELEGKQVTLQFTNTVTRRTEPRAFEAADAQNRVKANLETYRQLIDCLGK